MQCGMLHHFDMRASGEQEKFKFPVMTMLEVVRIKMLISIMKLLDESEIGFMIDELFGSLLNGLPYVAYFILKMCYNLQWLLLF